MSLTLFSQKTTLIDGDTSICFSVAKSKYLLKQIYLVSEKDALLKITEQQLKICIQEKIIYENQLSEFQQYIDNQKEITSNITAVSTQKEEQIKALAKELKKQKSKTWLSIFGGIFSTAFVSYLWISK
jgi:uncharacterized membrane-anchored protein YitT (DUF2179 family)